LLIHQDPPPLESQAFLERQSLKTIHAVYVVHGDEDFLKREVIKRLRQQLLGNDANEFSLAVYEGDSANFAALHDELQTLPFLGPRRLVIVETADPFVSKNRAALEKYVGQPSASGILVLEVKTWPATTRLAKMIDSAATIACKAPPTYRLPDWAAKWARSRYGCELDTAAARLLVDLVGAEMGQLDQELAKLSVYVGAGQEIDLRSVDSLVGSSRAESTFKIFDAIAAGNSRLALEMLDRLLNQGEDPIRMLGAFSLQLRRLAKAGRLGQRGVSIYQALNEVGVPPFARQSTEQLMNHLGPRRVQRLYGWLLEVDLGMKGGSQLTPRQLLERLVARMAVSESMNKMLH
jgi:DNA polymerase-3 subunit delta